MAATTQRLDVVPVVCFARQALYRFASLSLLDPRAGAWQELNALRGDELLSDAALIIRQDPTSVANPLGRGERPLSDLDPHAVLAQLPATSDDLNRQYESTFGLLVSGACPPYESEYINGKFAVQRSQTMGDVSGFYRAFGLQTSTRHPERPDHIVLELEFTAFLLGMQLQAAQADPSPMQDRASVCRRAQERFFREHLLWWTPAFARLLSHEAGGGFYGHVAHFLAALITSERVRLGLPAAQVSLHPSPLQRPGGCEGCAFASFSLP